MSRLIKDTTREERINIINELYHCHNGDCDSCGICSIFITQSPLEVYQPYIDGLKELNEVSREFNESRRK